MTRLDDTGLPPEADEGRAMTETGGCWREVGPDGLEGYLADGGRGLPRSGLERLVAWTAESHQRGMRSRLEFYDDHLIGILVVPVMDRDDDDVWEQEVFFLATNDTVLTVQRHPPGKYPFDLSELHSPKHRLDVQHPGGFLYLVLSLITDHLVNLIVEFHEELEEAEDGIMGGDGRRGWSDDRIQRRLRRFRSSLLDVRKAVIPLLERVDGIMDRRLDLVGEELFPQELERRLRDVHDRLVYVVDALELIRDEVAGLRDFHQAKVANEQNQVMKSLTMAASLLLVPTLIVGMFGQNFRNLPWQDWPDGFWWSTGLVSVITLVQLAVFVSLGWIRIGRSHRGS